MIDITGIINNTYPHNIFPLRDCSINIRACISFHSRIRCFITPSHGTSLPSRPHCFIGTTYRVDIVRCDVVRRTSMTFIQMLPKAWCILRRVPKERSSEGLSGALNHQVGALYKSTRRGTLAAGFDLIRPCMGRHENVQSLPHFGPLLDRERTKRDSSLEWGRGYIVLG